MLLNPLDRRVLEKDGFPILAGAFPVVGHMPAMATDYLGLVRHAEKTVGPFFWLRSGFGRTSLHCLHPEAFSIFKNKVTTSTYLQEMLPELFGISVIVQDGVVHQHMRSAMNVPFLPRALTVSEMGTAFADLIERRVRAWRDHQGSLRILAETRELVLAGMFRILGVPEEELAVWRRHYENFMLLAINLPFDVPGSPRRRGRRSRAWLNEQLTGFIDAARARPDGPGLLTALVHARDEGGSRLSDPELLDNLRLLVLAGHETSASTMAWMVLTLAERPDVWEALCAESKAAGSVPRTPKELKSFPYAEAVFRETLRLHPPVSSDARRAVVDFELSGRTVRAGTSISVSISHLSRHPSLYEQPDEFIPGRWLNRAEAITPMELVQFGGGPHFCLGYHLAWLEIVQLGVAMALTMGERGVRPRLAGAPPKSRYLPLLHPSAATRVTFS